MVPSQSDNGARLAGILPTALAHIEEPVESQTQLARPGQRPYLRQFVAIVVDGLGWSNFRARRGHARRLASLAGTRLTTVAPSTTGAALTTLTTGRLPGTHGLLGYRIRHPEHGLLTTLTDWDSIDEVRDWQRSSTVFERAEERGVRSFAVGRPAHSSGGLTAAILTGTTFVGGKTIEDRFRAATAILRAQQPSFTYLYIDELDRAGHREGAESETWTRRLEQFDEALGSFLDNLPASVGVCVTADHGMVDVHPQYQIVLDEDPQLLDGVNLVGGEPRLRYLYVDEPGDAKRLADRLREVEGHRAWVFTREEAIARELFGDVDGSNADRIGDVILAARKRVVYYTRRDDPAAREMIGHHGSFTDDEVGVPLFLAGDVRRERFLDDLRSYESP